jgi:hypothetical protein
MILKKLIENELKVANDKFPPFQSRHEAYSVLLEELQELQEEIDDISYGIINDYWQLCRGSKKRNSEEAKKLLDSLESAINCAFKELIQLGAMVQKSKNLEEVKENKLSCFETCKHFGTSMCAYPERCKAYQRKGV